MSRHLPRPLAMVALVLAGAACTGTTSGAEPAPSPEVPATAATGPAPTTAPPATTAVPPPAVRDTTAPTTSVAPAPAPPPPAAPAPPAASGPVRTGRATHYRLASLGNCSFPDEPGADQLYVALNAADYGTAALCGAHLAVEGNRGSVTVKVVDQCPECPPGALDLSETAFARVTGDAGVTTVRWRVVSGPARPPLAFRIKEGSSQWWVGILVLHHRNPVRGLDARVGGRWVALERQDYNYFLAPQGLGPGPFEVRVTDVYGERLVAPGITPDAGRVFTTSLQLAGH